MIDAEALIGASGFVNLSVPLIPQLVSIQSFCYRAISIGALVAMTLRYNLKLLLSSLSVHGKLAFKTHISAFLIGT